MKLLKILIALALPLLIFQSCEKSEFAVNQTEGGLIEVQNLSLNYVVGNQGPYTANMRVYQGEIKVTNIEVFATFYSSRPDMLVVTDSVGEKDTSIILTQLVSNTVSFATITPSSTDQNVYESFSYMYEDLQSPFTIETEIFPEIDADDYEIIKGFSVNDVGQGIPLADGELTIGDKWVFEYHITTDDGRTVVQSSPTNATVATRYAGNYTIASSSYYRIGVPSIGLWDGEDALIESIDAKTYRWSDWGAPYGWDANGTVGLYFQIEADGSITYPASWGGADQVINDQPLITCELNPTDLTNVNCGGSNMVVNDDISGADELHLVHGYFTAGSGPREFEFILIKKVD